MTNADHDPPPRPEDRALAERLRRVIDPGLDDSAAERIADGAWRRAHAGSVVLSDFGGPRIVRRPRRSLRWAAAAAVLVAVAGGTFVLSQPSAAFAVEGEPVRVWNDEGWDASSRVRGDATVFAPAGTRALRSRDGSLIQPTAGSVFRIEPGEDRRFVVHVLRGSVEVSGAALQLDLGELVASAIGDDDRVAYFAQVLSDEPPTLAPPRRPAAVLGATPQIEVRLGSMLVRHTRTNETRELAANQIVTLGQDRRMLDVLRWSDDIAGRVALGAFPIDAAAMPSGDMVLHLRVGDGDRELATLVPRREMPDILSFVNFLTFENAVRLNDDVAMHVSVHVVRTHKVADAQAVREYIREKDGRTTALHVLDDGRVRILDETGNARIYPSLSAARALRADVIALFDDYLTE